MELPPWSFDPPTERSLAGDVLDRLVERGFETTARWYGRALAEHAGGRVYDLDPGVLNRLGNPANDNARRILRELEAEE